MSEWVVHDGKGCPLPAGTLVDVRHFNGEVSVSVRVGGFTVAPDGARIPRSRGRWSGWDYHDGGPMPPKFKAYRTYKAADRRARDTALFNSWLLVGDEVVSGR